MSLTDIHYDHILCPVDFSATSRKAFYVAVGQARMHRARLTILHIFEGGSPGSVEDVEADAGRVARMEAGIKRRLDELEADGELTEDDRRRMHFEIGAGKPWVEIVKWAQEGDVDLVVMGTHGHAGLRHILIGSQAERVVRRAPCHVLSVKPDGYRSRVSES